MYTSVMTVMATYVQGSLPILIVYLPRTVSHMYFEMTCTVYASVCGYKHCYNDQLLKYLCCFTYMLLERYFLAWPSVVPGDALMSSTELTSQYCLSFLLKSRSYKMPSSTN